MPDRLVLLVGTRKGAFIVESDAARTQWSVRNSSHMGQNVMHMNYDSRTGTTLAAVGDPWFGSRVYRSNDLGQTWNEPQVGITFPADSGRSLEKIWHVTPGRADEPGVLYAGVEPAALFKSTDNGQTWDFVPSLEAHPTRAEWQPALVASACTPSSSTPATRSTCTWASPPPASSASQASMSACTRCGEIPN